MVARARQRGAGTRVRAARTRRREGDGYLLVLVNRFSQLRSELVILEAQRLNDGPVALVRLPTRVRSTFHGMWVPDAALASGRYSV
ncbi:MAG: carotenoid oxygenase family protein [Steroidobacteraceae bacterium]